jgi:hypothetical protein
MLSTNNCDKQKEAYLFHIIIYLKFVSAVQISCQKNDPEVLEVTEVPEAVK